MSALVFALLLTPHLVDAAPVRLVSDGTGDVAVDWFLEGQHVATTSDGVTAVLELSAGDHELWATSTDDGDWRVLARLDPAGDQVAYVDAWSAAHAAEAPLAHQVPRGWLAAGLALVGAAVWVWPTRSKNP